MNNLQTIINLIFFILITILVIIETYIKTERWSRRLRIATAIFGLAGVMATFYFDYEPEANLGVEVINIEVIDETILSTEGTVVLSSGVFLYQGCGQRGLIFLQNPNRLGSVPIFGDFVDPQAYPNCEECVAHSVIVWNKGKESTRTFDFLVQSQGEFEVKEIDYNLNLESDLSKRLEGRNMLQFKVNNLKGYEKELAVMRLVTRGRSEINVTCESKNVNCEITNYDLSIIKNNISLNEFQRRKGLKFPEIDPKTAHWYFVREDSSLLELDNINSPYIKFATACSNEISVNNPSIIGWT